MRSRVQAALRYLIVDEYQDVNPAQERLTELLTAGGEADLCVVGDDDQAIYQWRGSDVRNIVEFGARYPGVQKFEITENRRSVPSIVITAAGFARSIPGRLDKEMHPVVTSLFGDIAAALREHGSATLDEHCCYFRRPN